MSPAGVTISSCVYERGCCNARYSTASAIRRMSPSAFFGTSRVKPAVLGDSIVASTISSATWMPSSRSSCAAACTIARVACPPADQRPRPGIARRAEPPVTCMSVPPSPDSRSAWMPVDRNTKACSATTAAQPWKPSSVASPIGPPPKPLSSSGGRLAATAFTIRLGGPSSSRTRTSAAESASGSLASAAIPSAPRSLTAAAVSSLRAMAAPRQSFSWR